MFPQSACLVILIVVSLTVAEPFTTVIPGICLNPDPVVPTTSQGPGCGIPAFVNATVFGDNSETIGNLTFTQRRKAVLLHFNLYNLPKPDLVLTAWLVWLFPSVEIPDVFNYAAPVSPCASFRARFSSGMRSEPNQFRYTSATHAHLRVLLNFNPTYPNEGALVANTPSFQADVPGIQTTALRQPPVAGTDRFIPVSANFLRRYDQRTGFQLLDRKGRPVAVTSPLRAQAVVIVGHVDKATHGIWPGVAGVDHYEIISFIFPEAIGERSMT